MAGIYQLIKKQYLPIDIDEAWKFISSPENLKVITPKYMGFNILSPVEKYMYAGQIIEYTVKPIMGIPMKWVTEITHLQAPYYFVDEQRFGPYKFWHHKHFLSPKENGVEMIDHIHYSLPLGILGRLVNAFMVNNQLEEIFNYRRNKLTSLFSTHKATIKHG